MSNKRTGRILSLILRGIAMALLVSLLLATGVAQQSGSPQAQVAKMPLAFEPNQGQADPQVQYLSRGQGYLLLLTRDEAVLALSGKNGKRETLRLAIDGADRRAKAAGVEMLEGKTSYFLGNDASQWRTNIPNYKSVRYSQIYPGIDLLYYGKQTSLEHDFIVAPNADPSRIALKVKGAKRLGVDADGNLILTTEHGRVQLDKPFIYQVGQDGKHIEVAGGYTVKGSRVSFRVGAYDKSRELVIDPVLNYATYFGGDATTTANAITVDTNGNAYITGSTTSTTLTANPACGNCTATPNNDEIYVLKLNATGSGFTNLAIIGGSGSDTGLAIAIDSAGTPNVYITGQTSSNNFPTVNALRAVAGNNPPDGFVVKLQSDFTTLNYSSYLNGGNVATDHADVGRGIAVDASNFVYVAGSTASTTFLPPSFVVGPQLANADNTGATTDAFVVKIDPAASGTASLLFGTYWGGTGDDAANAIALDSGSRIFITGNTSSTDFPLNGSAVQSTKGTGQDGFAMNIPAGGGLLSSINCTDSPNNSITVTTTGPHGLIVGDTFDVSGVGNNTNGLNFNATGETVATVGAGVNPTTFTYTSNGNCNNTTGQGGITAGTSKVVGRRKYSTYLGGNGTDDFRAVALDSNNNAFFTGGTTSTNFFNTTFQGAQGGGVDAFILKLNSSGSTINYSAFLGGANDEVGNAIAVNRLCTGSNGNNCEIYIGGSTNTAAFFNTNALQGTIGGGQDGFIARFKNTGNTPGTNGGIALVYKTYFGGAGTDSINGLSAVYSTNSTGTNVLYLAGNTSGSIGAASSFGGSATVTSSAAQRAAAAGATGTAFVAKLQASDVANPALAISGVQNPTGVVGQATSPVAFASTPAYNFTVTNTSLARAVTVDIPTPQSSNVDVYTVGTPVITGSGSATSSCTKAVGTSTAPGGVTCLLQTNTTGDFAAASSTTISVPTTLTSQAHCANAPCTNISVTAKVASAETGSLQTSNTVTSTVVPVVNLEVAGTVTTDVGADAVFQQGTDTSATYSITVTNNSGATNAAVDPTIDILLTADYPTNFVVDSTTPALTGGALAVGTPACKDNAGGHQLQCTIDTIAAGGNSVVTIVGHFTSAASNPALGTLFTTSKFPSNNATELFTATGNNTNVAVNIAYQALSSDVQITSLADNTDPIQAGQTLTYTISFRNNGPTDATNAVITTSFTGFAFDAQTKPGFCTQANPGANVVCNVGGIATMDPINDPDLTITLSGPAPLAANASFVNGSVASTIAADQFDGTANNTGNQTTRIERQATLSITTATSTTPVAVGGAVTFNVTVHNANTSPSTASNVVATITLPAGFTSIASGTSGCVVASQVVTCTTATLAANADYAIQITANAPTSTITANDDLSTSVSVDSNGTFDPTGLPHTATIHTFVTRTSDLVLTTATDNSPVRNSGPLTFSTVVTNNGPDPANNVKVKFTLPNSSYTLSGNTFNGGCLQASAVITCSITGTIANAGTNSSTMSVTPDPATPGGTASVSVNTNVQAVSTTVTDDGTAGAPGTNNSKTVNSTIERQADLTLTGFGGEGFTPTAAVSSTGQITYTLAVRNNGPDTATGIKVKLTLDSTNFNFVSTNGTGCVVSGGGFDLVCDLANINSGNQVSFQAVITPGAGFITSGNSATLTATPSVSGTVVDDGASGAPGANNARSSAQTAVQRQANLRASGTNTTFNGPVSAINSSATASYNASVRNDGPDAVTPTVVRFTFTSAIAGLDTSGAAQTAWSGLGTCVVTQLAAPAVITCTNNTSFASATSRGGVITISPDTATLLSGTNSATYDVVMDVASTNAYDNGTSGAPGSDNTSSPTTTTVQRQADLRIVPPVIAPNAVADGGNMSYTITVQNFGPDAAGSVRLVDPLAGTGNPGTLSGSPTGGFTLNAAGATFVSPTIPAGVCTPNSGSPTVPSVTVVCMLGPLNNGQSATITISGKADIDAGVSSATFNNIATVDAAQNAGDPIGGGTQTAFETNSGNNSNTVVSTTVSRSADLLISGIVTRPVLISTGLPDPVATNFVVGTHQSVQYDVTVQNNAGSSTTVTTGSVGVTLPATLSFNSGASPGCSAVGQNVTCPVAATLTPGTSATVTFVANPAANLPLAPSNNVPVTITPAVSAAGNSDPDNSNNAQNATISIDRVSDLVLDQTAPATPIAVTVPNGSTATFNYVWTVTNQGPSNATGVTVTNLLPADLTFVSGSWPAVTGTSSGTCSAAGQTVTCNVSTISTGATVTITLTVRPNLSTSLANKQVPNQPSVAGAVQDTDSSNNSQVDFVELRGVTDLQVTITPVQDPAAPAGQVLVGNNQTWTVAVKNNGPYPAGGTITLTDTIDPSVALVSVQPAAGGTFSCVGAVCTVSIIPPSPAPGSTQTVNVVTTTPASAVVGQTTPLSHSAVVTQYSNGISVASDVTDPTPANNTGVANVTGRAAADVGVTQTAPNGTNVGLATNTVKFRMQVSNVNGRSDATGVVLTNSIVINPNGAVPTTATGAFTGASSGNCNAATGLGSTLITITCPLGTIPTGGTTTVDLTLVPVLDSGSSDGMTNTPSVTRTEVDPVSGNNSAAALGIKVSTVSAGQQTFSPTNPNNGQPIPSVVITGFVSNPGATTMVVPTANPGVTLPPKYQFGSNNAAENYYQITNTTVFTGGIQLCVQTPETFFQPGKARVFLVSGGTPNDVTTATGFNQASGARQVCATVPTISNTGSTYVVMEPINTPPTIANATVTTTGGGKGAAGVSATLDGQTVTDPDSFACVRNGVNLPSCPDNLIFRWVGNFTDITTVDPATGLKVIVKDCSQPASSFFDGNPCTLTQTSLGLGSNTVTLQVFDDFSVLNPPAVSRQFAVGVSGGGPGGVTSQTVSVGQTGTFSFPYTFFANTTFAFTGNPALAANGITCSAQPLTYTAGTGAQTATVTVLCSTSSPVFASNTPPSNGRSEGSMVAGLVGITSLPLVGIVLLPARSRRRRMVKMAAMAGLIALMMVFNAACGGGGGSGGSFGGAPKLVSAGTPKGTYTINVNATPGSNPVNILTLTVQ